MLNISDRCAAGEAALDAATPDWYTRVIANQISIGTLDRCILGQVYGEFIRAPGNLCRHAVEYGFDKSLARPNPFVTELDRLNREWKRRVRARQLAHMQQEHKQKSGGLDEMFV